MIDAKLQRRGSDVLWHCRVRTLVPLNQFHTEWTSGPRLFIPPFEQGKLHNEERVIYQEITHILNMYVCK